MNVGETHFEERCDACGEARRVVKVGHGKRAKRVTVCACPETVEALAQAQDKPLPISQMKGAFSTKRAGHAGETGAVTEWEKWGFQASLTAGSGAVGSRSGDRRYDCDVRVRCGDFTARLESKNLATSPVKNLLKLMGRADVLRIESPETGIHYLLSANKLGELAGYASEAIGRSK